MAFGHRECEVPMSSASKRSLLDCPEWPRALSGVQLGNDERLLWAGRPVLAGYGKQLLWAYPLCVPFGVGALIGGWYCYQWAVGAGAIWNPGILNGLAAIVAIGAALLLLPLLWPLRLWRCCYALTTERLIIREPALVFCWPRIRQLKVGQGQSVRVKRVCTWLPDQTGDICYGTKPLDVMERIPRAPEVVALIREIYEVPVVDQGK